MGLIKETISMRPFAGFKPSDPARDSKQAFEIARSYPDDMPSMVVKTGKRGDVYPYTIFVRERFGDQEATKKLRKFYK